MADERKVRVSRSEVGSIRWWLRDEIRRLESTLERHQAMLAQIDVAMTVEGRKRARIHYDGTKEAAK